MFQKVIASQAQWLANKLDYEKPQEEILNYSLTIVVNMVVGYTVLVIIAGLLGLLPTSITAALTASLLRLFSGGAHASRSSRCTGLGVAVLVAMGWFASAVYPLLPKIINLPVHTSPIRVFLIIIIVLGTVIFYLYSPTVAPGKPKPTHLQWVVSKSCSLALLWWWGGAVWLVSSWTWGHEHQALLFASELGAVWQIISLTPLGYMLLHGGEKVIDFFNKSIKK